MAMCATIMKKIYFYPFKWAHIGHYECIITLSDTVAANTYSFYLDVLNFPPKFANNAKP